MALTANQIREKLGHSINVVSKKKNGNFVAKKSYFHRNTTTEAIAKNIQSVFPDAKIVDEGDHWHAFVGGAAPGTAKDSYLWVEFKLN